MKTTKIYFSVVLAFTFSLGTIAQTEGTPDSLQQVETPPPTYYKKSAIAINISTLGVGLEYAYNLNTNLNLRARVGTFSVSDYAIETELSQQPVLLTSNANITHADVLLEYLPFKRSSFKLIGGASYFFDAGGSINVLYNENIQYGEIELSPEEIGNLTIMLDYAGLAPYVGFGFGRAVPKRRVGLGIEIGTYYAGSPEVSIAATEMLEPTAEKELAQLEENLSGYAWLPFINLRLVVKL